MSKINIFKTISLLAAGFLFVTTPVLHSREAGFRVEKDLLGEKEIPADAYYGIQTARALENFQISGIPLYHYPELIEGCAIVKMGAARANNEFGLLDDKILKAIEYASNALIQGEYHNQFPVDYVQGGAGTSTNMNANEVIANIGLVWMDHKKGDYQYLDPHDHVNMSQSTNDFYPTAVKVGIILINDKLVEELRLLAAAFRKKGDEFNQVLKMGRTEMQDAVPMTVGQEFHAFASGIENEIEHLKNSERSLYVINMGGTAIGTGINAPRGFAPKAAAQIAKLLGKKITPAPDLIFATSDLHSFVTYSSALKCLAIKVSKICNDLRLLSSGPRAGFFEINLPPMQPGSSIMPGKVNPVIPEVVNEVCFRVIGNDVTVSMAAEGGQLQLNAFEPIAGYCIMESQNLFMNASKTLRTLCVDGITINKEVLNRHMETTIGIVTALNPIVGYEKATEIAKEAFETGKGVLEIIREKNILTEEQIKELMDPKTMTGLEPKKRS
ncbi:MAG: Aspartate ammonia-lyase [Chlamydiae bacterium]|nr:Aspartate ammonia-lyase [Chlamydiota bacterium]